MACDGEGNLGECGVIEAKRRKLKSSCVDVNTWFSINIDVYSGEGNGNPLQCSCLENPRDEGAWWAAVYGVAQSRTQLK